MRRFCFSILGLLLLSFVTGRSNSADFGDCVPKDINLKAKISESPSESSSMKPKKPLTIEQRLRELKATCSAGKLVDQKGKEIRFVHLLGCWGNPPEDYQERLDKQQAELLKLREKFTVIEIPCDQGSPLQEIN